VLHKNISSIDRNGKVHQLTISALPTLKNAFFKEHQNISMNSEKYNLFTVNKWIFKNPKCILYQKILDL